MKKDPLRGIFTSVFNLTQKKKYMIPIKPIPY